MTTTTRTVSIAQHAFSTAAAGPSQAPAATVDKAAQHPITKRFAATVSG